MKKFKRIFLHCSDSEFGHAMLIRDWHIQRKFRTIGYNIVIMNGYPTADWFNKGVIVPHLEGSVEIGRPIDSDQWFEPFEKGAGVYGWNEESFHACVIGKNNFSDVVIKKTVEVIDYWRNRLDIPIEEVLGHYERDSGKSCPNIDMDEFRDKLTEYKLRNFKAKMEQKQREQELKYSVPPEPEIKKPISIFQLILNFFIKGKKHG